MRALRFQRFGTVSSALVLQEIAHNKGGVQYTFWGGGFASYDFMEKAFAWRRDQILGDNLQLKIDVDTYNDMVRGRNPEIQLVLDYTDDVAEEQEMMKVPPKKVSVA
jgi:hypothetical protein